MVLESQANHVLAHLTSAILQDDVMANFQFQRLGYYWKRKKSKSVVVNLCE